MENTSNVSKIFFITIFVIVIILLWKVIGPIFGPLVFASIIAGTFYPLFEKIHRNIKNRRASSVISTFLIFFIIFIPIIYIVFALSKEAFVLYDVVIKGINYDSINVFFFGDGIIANLIRKATIFLNVEFNIDILKDFIVNLFKTFSSYIVQYLNLWLGNIVSFILDLFIMLVVIFSLFYYGGKLRNFFLKLSPMSLEENEDLINKFNQMNYVTLICNSIAGVIQGVLAGIVFWIAGVPAVILWALVMTLLAFMPIIGISIITIPTSVYFIITGQVLTGVSIFVSCSLISLLTENFFKPRFIGSRVQLNPIYVLLCIIGGMSTFGMGGIFYGPIIGIIFLTFASIYKKRYA